MTDTDFDSFLAHHGILGQKWGVRRFQNKDGSLTEAGKKRVRGKRVDARIDRLVQEGRAKKTDIEQYGVGLTNYRPPNGNWTPSALTNAHDFDWVEVEYDPYSGGLRTPYNAMDEFPIRDRESISAHENYEFSTYDLERINPGFGDPGTTQNCAKCSASMELRLRGIDCSAGRQTYPAYSDAETLWFKDARQFQADASDMQDILSSYGPKTSGTLSFQYPMGGGHKVHWTNNGGGSFQIQDGQNGRLFDSIDEMLDTYGGDRSQLSAYRLDDCEPNYDAMESDGTFRFVYTPFHNNLHSKVYNRVSGKVVDTW